jgi:hypothetical protein
MVSCLSLDCCGLFQRCVYFLSRYCMPCTHIRISPSVLVSDHNDPSFDCDYRKLPTSEKRVAAATRSYQLVILNQYAKWHSTAEFNEGIIPAFMGMQREKGLSNEEIESLFLRIAHSHLLEQMDYDPHRIVILILEAGFLLLDLCTDVALLSHYSMTLPTIAVIQGCMMSFSYFLQCFVSLWCAQPLWVGLLGLIGTRPLVEAMREAIDADPFPGQKLDNKHFRFLCKLLVILVSLCLYQVGVHRYGSKAYTNPSPSPPPLSNARSTP